MNRNPRPNRLAQIVFFALLLSTASFPAQTTVGWPAYGGGLDADHYSMLTQINRANVHSLAVAWTFDTGEKGGLQDNPLIVGSTLYAYTPTQKVVAVDAATGKLKWKFDSGVGGSQPARGVAYWTDGKEERIFAGSTVEFEDRKVIAKDLRRLAPNNVPLGATDS